MSENSDEVKLKKKMRDRDGSNKSCPFCSLKQHLDRHLFRKHPDEAPTPEDAKKLATKVGAFSRRHRAPLTKIAKKEIEAINGDTLQLPGVGEKN